MGADRLAGQAPLIRAFFAFPLPDTQRDVLSRHLDRCAAVAPEFRWAPAGNLHLTVRFIGSAEQETAEQVAGRLDGQLGPAFDVALGGVGTFRRGRLARVVWLDVQEGGEGLKRIAARVEAECRAAGLEAENRAFKPHLTLARARPRDGAALPELPDLPAIAPWRAGELILFSSHLGRGGAVHDPIRAVRLAE